MQKSKQIFYDIQFCKDLNLIQTFLENQKLIGPSQEAAQQEIPDKTANYSQGFPVLYQEVHDFIKNRYKDRLDDYFTKSAKIHFIVQNDHHFT